MMVDFHCSIICSSQMIETISLLCMGNARCHNIMHIFFLLNIVDQPWNRLKTASVASEPFFNDEMLACTS